MDEQRNMEVDSEKKYLDKIIDMQLKTLDDLVNVNSLFTAAVFVGLSLASPDQRSLETRRECDADPVVLKTLVMYEVLSFSPFLVSGLAAKSLKVLINIYKLREENEIMLEGKLHSPSVTKILQSLVVRRTLFLISTGAAVLGVCFLTLSMVKVIQIRLGKLSCGSVYTLISVVSLTVLVLSSLMLYLPPMIFAAIARFKIKNTPVLYVPMTTERRRF